MNDITMPGSPAHWAGSFTPWPLDPLLKEDFHGLIRTDWDAQFAGDALVPFKGDLHIRPLDIQCLRGTDTDAGCAVGTAILMPFDVLRQ